MVRGGKKGSVEGVRVCRQRDERVHRRDERVQ